MTLLPSQLSVPKTMLEYTIETTIDNGIIKQKLLTEDLNNTMITLSEWIFDTREQQLRDALKKLGWIPPLE